MNQYTFTDDNGITYKRISKTSARKAYKAGYEVVICACNMRPFTDWHYEHIITQIKGARKVEWFEQACNSYDYYNCRDTQTGRYSAYYIAITD